MKPWVVYSLIRVGVFAAAFAILLLTPLPWWVGAILAAVIGLCVSTIFFGGLRDAVAADLAARRHGPPTDADAEAEDR